VRAAEKSATSLISESVARILTMLRSIPFRTSRRRRSELSNSARTQEKA